MSIVLTIVWAYLFFGLFFAKYAEMKFLRHLSEGQEGAINLADVCVKIGHTRFWLFFYGVIVVTYGPFVSWVGYCIVRGREMR